MINPHAARLLELLDARNMTDQFAKKKYPDLDEFYTVMGWSEFYQKAGMWPHYFQCQSEHLQEAVDAVNKISGYDLNYRVLDICGRPLGIEFSLRLSGHKLAQALDRAEIKKTIQSDWNPAPVNPAPQNIADAGPGEPDYPQDLDEDEDEEIKQEARTHADQTEDGHAAKFPPATGAAS